MIDPKRETWRWGPIDSKTVYIAFMDPIVDFNKRFSPGWPDIIIYYKNNKILAIIDEASLRKNGIGLFNKIISKDKETKKYYDIWLEKMKKLVKYQEDIKDLEKLDDKEFSRLFDEWYDSYNEFWVYGLIPEVANFGAEIILKEKLLEINKENFIEMFESLSAPEDLSFYQIEEHDLLKLKQIKDKSLFEKKLEEHQEKYYWLRNSYGHSEILPVSYFKEELSKFTETQAKNKIKEIEEFPEKTKQKKREIIKKYKIPKDVEDIARKLSFSIWWQDFRKKFIFIAIAGIERFVTEASKRLNISKEELYQYTLKEFLDLLKSGKKIEDVLDRKKGCMEYYHEDRYMERYKTEKANEIIKPFLEIEVDENLKEIKGLPVSRGKAKGKVKIILSPLKMTKMNFGDILVAPMTSPDFIVAMKKSAGIITDEGGMTSHAAIVSREMKKPCIVGTKIATKILKDNDEVELDADKGIVKILERAR